MASVDLDDLDPTLDSRTLLRLDKIEAAIESISGGTVDQSAQSTTCARLDKLEAAVFGGNVVSLPTTTSTPVDLSDEMRARLEEFTHRVSETVDAAAQSMAAERANGDRIAALETQLNQVTASIADVGTVLKQLLGGTDGAQ